MMKYVKLFAPFLMFVFCTSYGQNQTNGPKDNIKSETKDTVSSDWPSNNIVTKIKHMGKWWHKWFYLGSFPL